LFENSGVYEIMWKNVVQAREATDGNIMLCGNDAICTPDD